MNISGQVVCDRNGKNDWYWTMSNEFSYKKDQVLPFKVEVYCPMLSPSMYFTLHLRRYDEAQKGNETQGWVDVDDWTNLMLLL